VLAATLKDNGRATIVGETSFGKGTVNIARSLPDGGALFVTIARWLTPAGVQIDGVGITPDVEVTYTPGVDDPGEDLQLARAIEQLRTVAAAQQPATSGAP
jgi:carboxyl-terminal processing protease